MSSSRGRHLCRTAVAAALMAGLGAVPAYAVEGEQPPGVVQPAPEQTPVADPPAPPPSSETGPSVQPVVTPPEPAVTAPAPGPTQTTIQRNPFSGYAVHPGTGYLIEPGTNNLIDASTGFYTDLRWDPVSDTVRNIFEPAPDEDASSPSPSESAEVAAAPSAKASATKSASPSPSASPSESVTAADRASSAAETNWSTHWLTRTVVFLLLTGAGVLYYIKLQKGTTGIGKTDPGQNVR